MAKLRTMSNCFEISADLPKPFTPAKLVDASCRVMGDDLPSRKSPGAKPKVKRYNGWRLIYDGWLSDGGVLIKIPVTEQAKIENMLAKRIAKYGLNAGDSWKPSVESVLPRRSFSALRRDWTGEYKLLKSDDPLRGKGVTKRSQIAAIQFEGRAKVCTVDAHYLRTVWSWWPQADMVVTSDAAPHSSPLAFHTASDGWVGMLAPLVGSK